MTPDFIARYQDSIMAKLHALLDGSERNHIKMVYYHLGWLDSDFKPAKNSPGKLSRPSLTLLTAEKLGGDIEEALTVGASIQTFHDFTLMHDDIEDGDPLRRHRETVWKIWGIPRAINAGDAMYTLSIQSLLGLKSGRLDIPKYLLEVYAEIVAGQELDLSFVDMDISSIEVKDYLEMIGGKSAWLIGASCKAGAMVANAEETICDSFYNYGFNLGLAYQIYDDLVSVWGSSDKSGKVEHMDIYDRKKTLPIIMLHAEADEGDKKAIASIYSQETLSDKDVETVIATLDKYQVREKMEKFIEEFRNNALSSVDELGLEDTDAAEYREIVEWLIPKGYR